MPTHADGEGRPLYEGCLKIFGPNARSAPADAGAADKARPTLYPRLSTLFGRNAAVAPAGARVADEALPTLAKQSSRWVGATRDVIRREQELRAKLAGHGELLSLDIVGGEARVRFSEHASAKAVVALFEEGQWTGPGSGADFVYNERLYEGPDGRGWTQFEQGVAKLALSHFAEVGKKVKLPKFERAEASRHKVTDISDGKSAKVRVNEKPAHLLRSAQRAIQGARFVGKGDKPMVQQMLGQYDLVMQTAVGDAADAQDEARQPDPSLGAVSATRRRASVWSQGSAASMFGPTSTWVADAAPSQTAVSPFP